MKKRPVGVWVITIIHVISLFVILLGFDQELFELMTIPDIPIIIIGMILNIAGIVLLFSLKKLAFYLLLMAEISGVLHSIYALFFTDYLDGLGLSLNVAIRVTCISEIIPIVILFYTWFLIKKTLSPPVTISS